MEVLFQGSLRWFGVIVFISLVNLANAPVQKHLTVEPVCIGETLFLPWDYSLPSQISGNITWNFQSSKPNRRPEILATFILPNGTFDVKTLNYVSRLSSLKRSWTSGGLQLSNVTEDDAGSYGIIISIDTPKSERLTDSVDVSVVDFISNHIEPTDGTIICSVENNWTSLSWKVSNKYLMMSKGCKRPAYAEWRRNGTIIAKWNKTNDYMRVEPDSDFQGRLKHDMESPLTIVIITTRHDGGNYTIAARYGSSRIESDIYLQVSVPMNIPNIGEIRQCEGTDVVFPWAFDPGRECNNNVRAVDSIVWSKLYPNSTLASCGGDKCISSDIRVAQDKMTNAGLTIRRVQESDSGIYEVAVKFTNGNATENTAKLTVVSVILTTTNIDEIKPCEGTDVVFPWAIDAPRECIKDVPASKLIIYWNKYSPNYLNLASWTGDKFKSFHERVAQDKRTNAGLMIRRVQESDSGMYVVMHQFRNVNETGDTAKLTVETPLIQEIVSDSVAVVEKCEGESFVLNWKIVHQNNCSYARVISRDWFANGKPVFSQYTNQTTTKEPPWTTQTSTFSFDSQSEAGLKIHNVNMENSGNYSVTVSFEYLNGTNTSVLSNIVTLVLKKAAAVSLRNKTLTSCTDASLHLVWDLELGDCSRAFLISWYFRGGNQGEEKIGSNNNGTISFEKNFEGRVTVTNRTNLVIEQLTTKDSGIYTVRLSYTIDQSVVDSKTKNPKDTAFSESSITVTIYDASSNSIVPTDGATICSTASYYSTSLSWKVRNKQIMQEENCTRPTSAKWKWNRSVTASWNKTDESFTVEPPDSGFQGRLRHDSGSPLTIIIQPTRVTDEGSYTVIAKYGDLTVESATIDLQVSVPITIKGLQEIKQCEGTDVVFPWAFDPGTECNHDVRAMDSIVWSKLFPKSTLASWDDDKFISSDKRFEKYKGSNAGLTIHRVMESDSGYYEVVVKPRNGTGIYITTKLTVVAVTLTTANINDSKQCEGTDVVFPWAIDAPRECIKDVTASKLIIYWKKSSPNSLELASWTGDKFKSFHERVAQDKRTNAGLTIRRVQESDSGIYKVVYQFRNVNETGDTVNLTVETPLIQVLAPDSALNVEKCEGESFVLNWKFLRVYYKINCSYKKVIRRDLYVNGKLVFSHYNDQTNVPPSTTPTSTFSFDSQSDAGLKIHNVKMENSGNYRVTVWFEYFNATNTSVLSNIVTLVLKKAAVVSAHDKTLTNCTDASLYLEWDLELGDCSLAFLISWYFRGGNQAEEKIGSNDNGNILFEKNFEGRATVTNRTNLAIEQLTTKDSGIYTLRLSYTTDVVDSKVKNPKDTAFSESSITVTIYDAILDSIVPNDGATVCSTESNSTSLSWKVTNKQTNREENCTRPTSAKWKRNANVIASWNKTDESFSVEPPDSGFQGRLRHDSGSPFTIVIEPTRDTDEGSYTVTAKYGDFPVESATIDLQVSIPINVSRIEDIRQCIGTDVAFPWVFNPGRDCDGSNPQRDFVVWKKLTPQTIRLATLGVQERDGFLADDSRIKRYKDFNAGLMIDGVLESDSGEYEVAVRFKNKQESATNKAKLTVETPRIPVIERGGSDRVVEKCEAESFVLNWTFIYTDQNNCSYARVISRYWHNHGILVFSHYGDQTTTDVPPSTTLAGDGSSDAGEDIASVETKLTSASPPDVSDTSKNGAFQLLSGPDSSTYSFDGQSDAGLTIHNVKLENGGNYHVNVSFDSSTTTNTTVVSENIILVVRKAAAVSLRDGLQKREVCTDAILHLNWTWGQYDCSLPFTVSFYLLRPNQAEQKIIIEVNGKIRYGKKFVNRATVTNRTNLAIRNLSTDDSGIYTIRLSYTAEKSDIGGKTKNPEDVVFSVSPPITVTIFDSSSSECAGQKFDLVDVRLTRDGEDVRSRETNRTVFVNDTITISYDIPAGTGFKVAQFFWMELHHKHLKQFFGKKCWEPGLCSIYWKVSRRLPGVVFFPGEYRREVMFGMKIIFLQDRTRLRNTTLYFRNHKEAAEAAKAKSTAKGAGGKRGKGGIATKCALSKQIVLASAIFWILVHHQ